MNISRSLFKGNLNLRKAVNYAINRKDYVSQAGPYAGQPWTHIFNPGVPGWRERHALQEEPDHGEEARAKGHFKSGKITVCYRSSGDDRTPRRPRSSGSDLISLGFKSGNIT